MKNPRILFLSTFVLVLSLSLLALQFSGGSALLPSFAIGALLGLMNVGALYFSWKKLFEQKSLALSGGVIVLKYPVLGFIIYEVLQNKQIRVGWFLTGMGTVLPAALISLIFWSIKTPKIKSEISLKIS